MITGTGTPSAGNGPADPDATIRDRPVGLPPRGQAEITPTSHPGSTETGKPPAAVDDPGVVRASQQQIDRSALTITQFMAEHKLEGGVSLDSTADESKSASQVLTADQGRKYKLGKVVAKGGMGAILDAKDTNLRRSVAMKVLLHPEKADQEQILRFIQEAQVTSQLEHPSIVPVHELGVDASGNVFYTMKFVQGVTLKDVLKRIAEGDKDTIAKYPLPRLLNLFQRVCDAMAFAHSRRVIHRDLKPENVMIGEYGEVQVMDWGLAKVLGGRDKLEGAKEEELKALIDSVKDQPGESLITMQGALMGTPNFMAPEQAQGHIDRLDERTDIYALGAILYNILTLQPPVVGKDIGDVLSKVLAGDIRRPTDHNAPTSTRSSFGFGKRRMAGAIWEERREGPHARAAIRIRLPHLPAQRVPAALGAVAMKCLNLAPEQRYSSVPALQADIEAYQTGFATVAEEAKWWTHTSLWLRRHRTLVLAACGSLAVAAVFGWWWGGEALKRIGTWRERGAYRFDSPEPDLGGLHFLDHNMAGNVVPVITVSGLSVPDAGWCWTREPLYGGDARAELEFVLDRDDSLEFAVGARQETVERYWFMPAGTTIKFSFTRFGTEMRLLRQSAPKQSFTTARMLPALALGERHRVAVETDHNAVRVYLNGDSVFEQSTPVPIAGSEMNRVGFRFWQNATTASGLRLWTMRNPERASPLLGGDTLARYGQPEAAENEYQRIADDYADTEIEAAALLKRYALVAASTNLDSSVLQGLRRRMREKHPRSPHAKAMEHAEAVRLWKQSKWDAALTVAEALDTDKGPAELAVEMLTSTPESVWGNRRPVPRQPAGRLLGLLRHARHVRALDLRSLDITDVTPLSHLQLEYLNISSTLVTNLHALVLMPLRTLNIVACTNLVDASAILRIPTLLNVTGALDYMVRFATPAMLAGDFAEARSQLAHQAAMYRGVTGMTGAVKRVDAAIHLLDAWIARAQMPGTIPDAAVRYGEHAYLISPLPTTWDHARQICEAHGGHLVTVTSLGEYQLITNLIARNTFEESNLLGTHLGALLTTNSTQWITGEAWVEDAYNQRMGTLGRYGHISHGNHFGSWWFIDDAARPFVLEMESQ